MILNLDSKIDKGAYKGKTVDFILKNNKKEIFNLLKEGYMFEDYVLSSAGIKKNIRNTEIKNVVVEHEVDNKTYEKDTLTINRILNDISTIDKMKYNSYVNTDDTEDDEEEIDNEEDDTFND